VRRAQRPTQQLARPQQPMDSRAVGAADLHARRHTAAIR
jgi:hypothetical protein